MSNFLLVGSPRQSWRSVLDMAVKPMGELDSCEESDAITQLNKARYDVVIVDASGVEHPDELVFRIRGQRPSLRIVVATAAPTWQLARSAFLYGATDYIHKSADKNKLSEVLVDLLRSQPIVTKSSHD